jgi:hypothetical protein
MHRVNGQLLKVNNEGFVAGDEQYEWLMAGDEQDE